MKHIFFLLMLSSIPNFCLAQNNQSRKIKSNKKEAVKTISQRPQTRNTSSNFGKVKIIVSETNLIEDSVEKPDNSLDIQPFHAYIRQRKFFKEMTYLNNGEFELKIPKGI